MRKHISELSGYCGAGEILFDFKKAAYAQLEIELDSPAEDLAQVVISECAENGRIAYGGGWRTFKMNDFRVTRGQKVYRFQIPTHQGCYGVANHLDTPADFGGEVAIFRYVYVNHYYGPVKVRRIEFFNDAPEDAAHFESSNEKLDEIWEFCKYSMLATSIFPCYIDGERERLPYEADAYIAQMGHFCSGADYSIARNTIDYFMENGDKTWPTEWLLLTPYLAHYYNLYSGDTASLERWLPELPAKALEHFCRKEDGLLVPQGNVRDIVDWPETCLDGYEFKTPNFVPNAFRYGTLLMLAEMTGDSSYVKKAESLKAMLRKKMLKKGLFVDNPESSHTGLHTAMFALRFGLAEGQEVAAHQAIVRKSGMKCSVYAAQFLLESCFVGGMDDLGIQLMTSDGEWSWMNMLRKGATVTMEAWDDSLKPNQDWSHPWGAAPANIIPRYVAGVRPVAAGFSKFEVKPSCAAPEKFFLRQPTPFGAVEVRKDGAKLDVTLVGTDRKLKKLGKGLYALA
ncbi:MAG: hypothetical protein MJ202_05750 [Lentisphaeria bacterium]|nr:hypothetical protein [Lentisphaeria bacterium]